MHSISSDANYLHFCFSNMAILREEREKCENCKRPSLSTNEAEFNYLKYSLFYPLIAEKYKDSVSINKSRVAALTRSL